MSTNQEVPSEETLKQTGYILALEDRIDPDRVPDVVDGSLLIDVTGVDRLREPFQNLLKLDDFGNRIFLCNDPKVVWEAGMGGMSLFRSTNPEGQNASFMIVHVKRSAPVQEFVEEFLSTPKSESDA